jgi:hypothetical protein
MPFNPGIGDHGQRLLLVEGAEIRDREGDEHGVFYGKALRKVDFIL